MTQEELIEKETESLRKLTETLREVGALLDRARECEGKEGKRALLSRAYKAITRFNQQDPPRP